MCSVLCPRRCFLLFVSGFTLVAVATSPSLKLLGVALAAAQCGLGETTLLALSTRYPPSALTAWASGTGAAGIFGYLYVIALERWLGLPSRTILLLGPVLAVAYYATFRAFGVPRDPRHDIDAPGPGTPARRSSAGTLGAGRNTNSPAHPRREVEGVSTRTRQEVEAPSAGTHGARGAELSNADRLRLTLSLYPWALPLILVYFAEYALQAGTWSAIGFPVTDRASRNAFYQNANWCYQVCCGPVRIRGRSCYGAHAVQTMGISEDPPGDKCNHQEASSKEQKLPRSLWN